MTDKSKRNIAYWEDYACGCVSEVVWDKKKLLGYCGTHGDKRRHVYAEREAAEAGGGE